MNIIDVILVAILGVSVISGMQKGFLTSLLATFGIVAAWILARTSFMTLSEQFMASELMKWLEANISFEGLLEGLNDLSGRYMNAVSDSLNGIVGTLTANGAPESIVESFVVNAGAFPTFTVKEYLSEIVWQAAFNVVSFAILFTLFYALILLVVNLLNNVFSVPKLRGVDALLGGVLGAVRGYAVICLICAIFPMLFTALDSAVIESMLADSSLGRFFITGDSVFKDIFKIGDQLATIVSKLP